VYTYDRNALTSNISLHSSVLPSDNLIWFHPRPALLMQTSILPYLLRINWNISAMSDSRRRSQRTGHTSPDARDFFTSSSIACVQQCPHRYNVYDNKIVYQAIHRHRNTFFKEQRRFIKPLEIRGKYGAHRIIWSWYTGRWWVGCDIWYSDEGTGQGRSPSRPPRCAKCNSPPINGQYTNCCIMVRCSAVLMCS